MIRKTICWGRASGLRTVQTACPGHLAAASSKQAGRDGGGRYTQEDASHHWPPAIGAPGLESSILASRLVKRSCPADSLSWQAVVSWSWPPPRPDDSERLESLDPREGCGIDFCSLFGSFSKHLCPQRVYASTPLRRDMQEGAPCALSLLWYERSAISIKSGYDARKVL